MLRGANDPSLESTDAEGSRGSLGYDPVTDPLLWNGKRRRRSFGHRGVRRGPSRRGAWPGPRSRARVTPNSERTSSVVAQSIGAATCAASFAVAVVAATTRSPSPPASSRRPAVGPPDVAAANACRSGATAAARSGVGEAIFTARRSARIAPADNASAQNATTSEPSPPITKRSPGLMMAM